MMKNFAFILLLFSILPQHFFQDQSFDENSSIVQGLCVYDYDTRRQYSCTLHNARIFNPTDILNITGTHLFAHTDEHVVVVYHQNVTLRYFNGEILRKFVNLQTIYTANHGIHNIHENAFEVCGQLRELNLIQNDVTEFPSQMLRNCVNLRIFNARNSWRLGVLPGDLFGTTNALELFYLSGQQLAVFPDNLLTNMNNLRVFDISYNRISHINPNNFINAVNLSLIDISWNLFDDSAVVMNLLNGHARLTRIVLTNNRFPMFDFSFFSQFQNLQELSVDIAAGHNLTSISWQFLPLHLRDLKVNRIGENIPENAFHNLKNLRNLKIRGLGINQLHNSTFQESILLRFLTITDTSIKTLPSQLFAPLINLDTLVMAGNQIEELPTGIFANLGMLGGSQQPNSLDFSGNKIRQLLLPSFGQHPHLRWINFSNNEIKEIQRGLFSRFNRVITLANFRSNNCIDDEITHESNLDGNSRLERCFYNFEGPTTTATTEAVTTTTPSGCGREFYEFKFFVILFAVINVVIY